jgi:hypothetical protein
VGCTANVIRELESLRVSRPPFASQCEKIRESTHRYTIFGDGAQLTNAQVVTLWKSEAEFRSFFLTLLAESPFAAYRWETPPVTLATWDRYFEFVLVDAPGLARTPDRQTFAKQFDAAERDGIAMFQNLGKDATLVVPAPLDASSAYDQLAAFIRTAPDYQRHALWRAVGQAMQSAVGERPIWLSTAGGGVAWLHVRLDATPKYYSYRPYTKFP